MDYAVKQLSIEPPVPIVGRKQTVLRVVEILLGLFMAIASGAPKLFGQETAVDMFDDIGWGDWFRYFVGVVEILLGIGLILPQTTRVAAIGLCGVMIGAFVFTLAYLEVNGAIVTILILFAIFAYIAWSRRTA